MKQIAQYQDGRMELQDVPMPIAPPGGVLVRTTHSVISVGTEKMKVEQARMNLLQKARARPDQVRKVLDTARNLGWRSALEKVRNRLETPTPLGYSAAGVVMHVDSGNTRFRVGDRVACSGTECAFHAEYIGVPDLLTAKVPDSVPSWQAAYTALCAVALHAVRQTEPTVGDRVLVMGQGLIGLLVTNFLAVSGARVLAVDLQPSRKIFAERMGAERVVIGGGQQLADEVRHWTEGYGVDAAIICTATHSNTPIEHAAEALRDRGRLVDVGITKIELPWKIFYEKELDVRFARSYGPGRYDPGFEWGGADYPIGYVRWTEQRNFQACLELMAQQKVHLSALTTRRTPFETALQVYDELSSSASSDIGVVLEYSSAETAPVAVVESTPTREPGPEELRIPSPVTRLDVVGAGNFARTMLLPHLQGLLSFGTVVNQTALSANHVKTKFGFEKAATDSGALTGEGGATLIATRHYLHAPLVLEGLEKNRHIFVEKPLCLGRDELVAIDSAVAKSSGSVMVGFNRRFAPGTIELVKALNAVPGPKSASYKVFAGKLDPQHWYANMSESGGRIVGEGCHFLDFFCFLFGSKPSRVFAQPLGNVDGRQSFPDSFTAQVEFSDGSSGQLIYSAEGDPSFPKETVTVFGTGLVAEMVNFQKLTIHKDRKETKFSYSSKGHAEEMRAWSNFLRGDAKHPLPYEQSRTSMLLTFAVLESIQKRAAISIGM